VALGRRQQRRRHQHQAPDLRAARERELRSQEGPRALTEEVELLVKAQTARGADFTHGTLRERAQSLSALFVPLLQGALRRAADLATALDARGYTVEGRQTLLHEGRLAARDYLTFAAVVLITVGALLV